jgi:hypothetical protein
LHLELLRRISASTSHNNIFLPARPRMPSLRTLRPIGHNARPSRRAAVCIATWSNADLLFFLALLSLSFRTHSHDPTALHKCCAHLRAPNGRCVDVILVVHMALNATCHFSGSSDGGHPPLGWERELHGAESPPGTRKSPAWRPHLWELHQLAIKAGQGAQIPGPPPHPCCAPSHHQPARACSLTSDVDLAPPRHSYVFCQMVSPVIGHDGGPCTCYDIGG